MARLYNENSKSPTVTFEFRDMTGDVNRVTAAATFYAAKYLEHQMRKAIIENPREGRSYPSINKKNPRYANILHSSVKGNYVSSRAGSNPDFPAVKTGGLASINGEDRGYRARTDGAGYKKVNNPSQLTSTGTYSMVIGTTLTYEKFLREGTRKMDPRLSLVDMEERSNYAIREISEAWMKKLDTRKGDSYKQTPQFPKELKSGYFWLPRYAKNDKTVR